MSELRKKIKQTFGTHQEVCHVWMSQSQELGRAGYFRFVNETLYVWDKAVARIYNKKTVLINPNIVEDCRMREKIMKSIPKGYKVFEVPSISPLYHQKNLSNFLKDIKSSYESFWKAHKAKHNHVWYSEYRIAELRKYVRHFSLRMPSLAGIRLNTKKARVNQQRTFDKEIERIYYKAHEANIQRDEIIKRNASLEQDWIEGRSENRRLSSSNELINYIHIPGFSQTRVRVSKGKLLETSDGAFVPIKEARVLYKLIHAGKPVHGFKIGHYTVIGINGSLKVGCHEIQREEIERIANVLGW